jgi:ABC-type nitrate/sulfonate/bicarbonate transport system substrate-binding protein
MTVASCAETTRARKHSNRLSPPVPAWRPVERSALTILWLLFGLCSAASADPLRLSISLTPLSLPFFVADSQGYFDAEGVKLAINEVVGGHRTMQQLLEGSADLATCSETVVMFNSFQRSDFAIIGSFVTSEDDVKIITRSDTGISTPQQLAGRTVATVTGAASHYFLDTLLLFSGVDPKKVHTRNLAPEAMVEALKNKAVDAIVVWEPIPFLALQAVPGARMLAKSSTYRLTFNLVARKSLLGVRDADLVGLLRALERAQEFIYRNPKEAKAILRQRLKLDQAFIDWIWSRYSYRLSLDQSLLTTLEGEARWARQERLVKGERSPNYLNFIYPSPLARVRPSAVNIIR